MKNIIKFVIGAALCLWAALAAHGQAAFQMQTYSMAGGTWTNRLAGSTSTTNTVRIDISQLKNIAVEVEAQNITGGASNLVLYIGKGNTAVSGLNTNAIDFFCQLPTTFSGTALTTTYGHTNFTVSGTGNQNVSGYQYLFLGPLTNLFAAGSSYATNVTVRITGN